MYVHVIDTFIVNMTVQKVFIFKKKEELTWDFEENYN